MRTVEKKLNKAQIITICLLIASIFLLASYFAISAIAKMLSDKASGNAGAELPEIFEGEDLYLNQPVAYSKIEEYEILDIIVKNGDGEFGLTRYPNTEGSFILYQMDKNGDPDTYLPPIYGAEGKFNYEDLYAVETGDGYGMMFYLTYLCSAIGAPYYTERIPLPSDTTARSNLLKEYGLTSSSPYVAFEFCNRDASGKVIEGTNQRHIVTIGDKAVSGSGYYFMVDNRDCVYYTASEYFKYALAGFHEYVKGTLVAPGLNTDPGISAALTPGFKSWAGKQYDKPTDAIFINNSVKYQAPDVAAIGNTYIPIDMGTSYEPEDLGFDGYDKTESSNLRFPLETLKTHPNYNRIKAALVGKTVGKYEGSDAILLTLIKELYESGSKLLDFSKTDSISYSYHISKIESVIYDDSEKTSGTVDASDKLLKVTYRYTADGATTGYDCHGIIDLSALSALGIDVSAFWGLEIGAHQPTAIDLDITYTKDSASLSSERKFVLSSINFIIDENGSKTDVITDKCKVNISYYYVSGDYKSETTEMNVPLSAIKEGDELMPLKTELIGKGCADNLSKVIYSGVGYYELIRDFATYEITEIKYFTVNELVVSFEYYNSSEWIAYYGETYYKNTLPPETGYNLYGLNADSCEQVVKYLSGMGTSSNATAAVGLSGKTVAVGLNADTIDAYGLYAHRIHIKLPRGIDVLEDESDKGSSDSTSDYYWDHELGFTLYISAPLFVDGRRVRYVGSDMYDIVAMVDAANFDFLEFSFVEFWASRNIIMMDIRKMDEMKVEFNMSDLKGKYDFDINFADVYGGYVNGEYRELPEQFDGSVKIERQIVKVTVGDGSFETELKRLANAAGGNEYSMHALYNHTQGDGNMTYYPNSSDYMGTAYFNSIYEILMLTRYHAVLPENEKPATVSDPIFRLHIKVDGDEQYYTYDFHRIDDRRVMVSLYNSDASGNIVDDGIKVSDFYITTFAFKKLVANYVKILNGELIDPTVGYPDLAS